MGNELHGDEAFSVERNRFLTETKITNLKHQLIKTTAMYLASCYTYCSL